MTATGTRDDTTAPARETAAPGLVRAVSRWEIVAFSLNDVIGSGVYLLPAAAAALLGGASVAAVVVAGAAVLLLVLCFAEAASYFDRPGSAYLYTREAFGDLVGFEVGWMTWLARVSAVASLAVGFAQALSFLWPAAGSGWGKGLAVVLPVLVLTAINVIGVKQGVRTAVFLTIGKILPLLVFIVAGTWAALRSPVVQSAAAAGLHWPALGQAALLLLFAYAGFENTAAPAGEFKRPERDVPFALLAQIVIVTAIYSLVQWVAWRTVPGLATSRSPLADGARLWLGPWGGWLLTAGAAISILGTTGNTVLSGPRYLYALARDGFVPRVLARIHPRFHTPAVAVMTQTAIALPLAASGTFEGLAALSVVARLATYLGTAAAVPVLRRKLGGRPGALRLPGGPLIPIAASLVCLALAASATRRDLAAGALAAVAGLAIFLVQRFRGNRPGRGSGRTADRATTAGAGRSPG
jgi:APA family basic amino acid/polyamine antiporter